MSAKPVAITRPSTPEEHEVVAARVDAAHEAMVARIVAKVDAKHEANLRRRARAEKGPNRYANGAAVLVVLWLVFAVPATMIGWITGDATQGLRLGTMAYGLLVGCLSVYGWHTRRRA